MLRLNEPKQPNTEETPEMPNCHEMKMDQVYVCDGCGLALKVVGECKDCGEPAEECKCGPCTFVCCDEPLKLKQ